MWSLRIGNIRLSVKGYTNNEPQPLHADCPSLVNSSDPDTRLGMNIDNIREKVIDNILAILLAFIFGTVLIGGGAFLFLESPTEFNALLSERYEYYEAIAGENEKYITMINQVSSGSLLRQDHKNMTQLRAYTEQLSDDIRLRKLDPEFMAEFDKWTSESRMKLTTERGFIEGYVFQDEAFQNAKKTYVKAYNLQIQLVEEINAIASQWEQMRRNSPIVRPDLVFNHADLLLKQTDMVSKTVDEILAHTKTEESMLLQLKYKNRKMVKGAEHKNRELDERARVFFLKFRLAAIGVGVVLMILAYISFMSALKSAKKIVMLEKRMDNIKERINNNGK